MVRRVDELRESMQAASMRGLSPEEVASAANRLLLTIAPLAALAALAFLLSEPRHALVAACLAVLVPCMAREAVLSYPRAVASRRASEVLRDSTEGMNLMIMSLRHEQSVPDAMVLAGERPSEFGAELRRALWSVIVGVHSSFEDALCAIGDRWASHSGELKSAVHAVITASCEATEEGRRRALERANRALVSGARRRIEDYVLALSLPAMILFAIGILLPLMVGSFLPMLSWSVWSADGVLAADGQVDSDGAILRTILLMNLLFPGIALLVVLDTRSRHPLPRDDQTTRPTRWASRALAALSLSAIGGMAALSSFDGLERAVALTLSATVPMSVVLVSARPRAPPGGHDGGDDLGDLLFRTGARMVEGENLDSALASVGAGASASAVAVVAGAVGRHDEADTLPGGDRGMRGPEAAMLEGFRVLKAASERDEESAGLLAMDLAGYLRGMTELEETLRRRLKPTISMMRLTTVVLAPLMMGVTYAIYGSLAAIGGAGSLSPCSFFLVLGVFLAETNAVVCYFVWVTDRSGDRRDLAFYVGACMLVSELLYSATAMAAS